MTRGQLIDHSELLRQLNYCPETGCFVRLITTRGRPAGATVGCVRENGRIYVGLQHRYYLAHRLAWFYVHMHWPSQEIDHINGDPLDNRLGNLREASRTINAQNLKRPKKTSTTGLMGVSKDRYGYRAYISVDRKRRGLGTFRTPEEAHVAYLAAKRQFHEGNTL